MKESEFMEEMNEKGWCILNNAISNELILRMRADIELAYLHCRDIQIENGIAENNEFTVHHLVGQQQSFLDYLGETPAHKYVSLFFSGPFILNSFGGAINTSKSSSYAHNIHRDVRSYSAHFPLLLNTLVMLDDFSDKNGATWLLSGSHKQAEKPSRELFDAKAEQAIAPAGSILIFDSNVWHAGGHNVSDVVRRSVTPMYSRPLIKQQFDYPRAIGYENRNILSNELQQIIGFNSRTPATLSEWYQPPEKRMYKRDQG